MKDNHMKIHASHFFSFLQISPQIYTIQDIEKATNTFKKKIGERVFGIVYDRKLNNIEVAVKVSDDSEKNREQWQVSNNKTFTLQ